MSTCARMWKREAHLIVHCIEKSSVDRCALLCAVEYTLGLTSAALGNNVCEILLSSFDLLH